MTRSEIVSNCWSPSPDEVAVRVHSGPMVAVLCNARPSPSVQVVRLAAQRKCAAGL